jgi:hypothetical protein
VKVTQDERYQGALEVICGPRFPEESIGLSLLT